MSLDVSLIQEGEPHKRTCTQCGHEHLCVPDETVYDANITHNLGKMADAAGIYKELWRPDEIGITKAWQLIQPLKDGLQKLEHDPDYFKIFNSPNGWGMYEHFVPFVGDYLRACEEYPDAGVSVCR